jgi:hypothetical protein
MKEHNRDKEKRDAALQTPDKGKKSKSKTPPPRSGSDKANPKGKGSVHRPEDEDKGTHKGHGIGNFDKGSEGAQGYGDDK